MIQPVLVGDTFILKMPDERLQILAEEFLSFGGSDGTGEAFGHWCLSRYWKDLGV